MAKAWGSGEIWRKLNFVGNKAKNEHFLPPDTHTCPFSPYYRRFIVYAIEEMNSISNINRKSRSHAFYMPKNE